MYEVIVLFVLGLVWIIFASIQDIKSREVANWISFSLIIFALGFRFFYSLFSSDFNFFYQGIFGLGIFFLIGNLLYYSRLFAGGDAKLMIALGAVLPFSNNFLINIKIFVFFLLLFLFIGAVYGLIIALVLSIRNFKRFKKDFIKRLKDGRRGICLIMALGLLLMILGFFESLLFIVGVLLFVFPYLYTYAKAVDNACMVREVKVRNLTEGDWLYKPIKIGKKLIIPSWEGLSKKDILAISKKYKKVQIKQGIAFVPVFLIALLVFFYLWATGFFNLI